MHCGKEANEMTQASVFGAAGDHDLKIMKIKPAIEPHVYKPVFTMVTWENDSEYRRKSIAIKMHSNLCKNNEDHDMRVIDDGMSLELAILWPSVLMDSVLLHSYRIYSDSDFLRNLPLVIAFRFLRRLRVFSNEEKIISRCTISIHFKVETERTTYLSWGYDGAAFIYITLKS